MKCRYLGVIILILLAGCSSDKPVRMPPLPENPQFIANTAEIKPQISSLPQAGVVVSAYTYDNYRYNPGELVNRLQEVGINQIYLDTRDYDRGFFGKELEAFLATMKNAGIPVWLLFSDEVVYEKRKFDKLFPRPSNLTYDPELVKPLKKFIKSCGDFHGIAFALTPHLCNHQRTRSLYRWSDNTYGIGGENDMLMKTSLKLAANLKKSIGQIPLALILPHFFQARAEAGDLSVGRLSDFAPFVSQFVITAFAETPSQSMAMVEPHLKEAAALNREIMVGLLADDHYSNQRPDSIANGSFAAFKDDLNKIVPELVKRHEFGGIMVINYRGLEILLEKPE